MKQILQNLGSGETELVDIPVPVAKKGCVLIRNEYSVVSSGTEEMLIDFARAGLIGKAMRQPEKVMQVLDKIKTDGIMPTLESIRNRLDTPLPLGYSSAGIVLEVGEGVAGLKKGDKVASNGFHGEIVCVPENLCARIPENVTIKDASFTVISAIAMQGIRLADPSLGENFAVIGLGLIGLITVQILRANGCNVIGFDFNEERLELARKFGAEPVNLNDCTAPELEAMSFTSQYGVDGVIITAATRSNDPVKNAARMCRKHGRIILVGVTGLELNRNDFYEKELTFQVSCSYGPGRYDPAYEGKNIDYPIGYVRWTEKRNFEAVLNLMEKGDLVFSELITHVFKHENMKDAYGHLAEKKNAIGILFEYPELPDSDILREKTVEIPHTDKQLINACGQPVVAFIGCGNYASQILIPAFKKNGSILHTVVSTSGVNASVIVKKHGFKFSTTDVDGIFKNPEINTVVVATRHDTHAEYIVKAIQSGKNVFVEKPLACSEDELEKIVKACNECSTTTQLPKVMTGFNRRFSSILVKLHNELKNINALKAFNMTINAGAIPATHWTQDSGTGGGRIIGEACHFVDLLRYLAMENIVKVSAIGLSENSDLQSCEDKVSIHLNFANGSIGTINYLANGNKSYPKERLEVFCDGRVYVVDNFKSLKVYGKSNLKNTSLWRQDKGNYNCVKSFLNCIRQNSGVPIDLNESIEVTQTTFDIMRSLSLQEFIPVKKHDMVILPASSAYDFAICKSCKQKTGIPKYSRKDGYNIYVCSSCGFHYIDYLDNEAILEKSSDKAAVLSEEDERYIDKQLQSNPERLKSKISEVKNNIALPGTKCLDIGAGGGLFLSQLQKEGVEIFGIEPNEVRRLFAKKKYDIDLCEKLVDDEFWQTQHKGYFDAVTLWDVIEHVDFPVECIRHSVNLVKSGGYIFIDTPARDNFFHKISEIVYKVTFGKCVGFLNILYSPKPFEHKQIFSTIELRELSEKMGLEVIKLEKFSEISFPAEFFLKKIVRSGFLARMLAKPATLLLNLLRVKNKLILVARKK